VFIKDLLSSEDLNLIKFGILHIRKQLSLEKNPPIIELAHHGFLFILLNLLDIYIAHDVIVYEILWCFTNFTAGLNGKDITNFFLTPKAFRIFEKILSSGKTELIYNLLWLITHIAADNESGRDGIINSNLFSKILDMLESDKINKDLLKHGIWLIANISKGSPEIPNQNLVNYFY
jgi:hypothetical protein